MLYFADTLQTYYRIFYTSLSSILKENKIDFDIISSTKDVWLKDFMPVKSFNNFVWFNYLPTYLRAKKYCHLITPKTDIHFKTNYNIIQSDLIIDGGNCLIYKNQAILTNRIYSDNKHLTKEEINNKLIVLLKLNKLLILPSVPNDFTGHIDGLARWLDDRTILLSNPVKEKDYYTKNLLSKLKNEKINVEIIENNTHLNSSYSSAKGCYVNYIELDKKILFPIFNVKSDEISFNRIQSLFPTKSIICINSNAIAKDGGLLHCISWQD